MKAFLILTILLCCVYTKYADAAVTEAPYSTAWPEICRVMALYRTCADSQFRTVCGYYANCSTDCVGSGMAYFKSLGGCIGGTNDGEHQWPYALEACSWYNGKLYVVKDAIDATVIAVSSSLSATSHVNTLIGGVNIATSNVWIHVDGTTVDNSFWNGGGNAPTNSNNQCMYSTKTGNYKQASEACSNNYPFICYSAPV